MMPDPVTAVSHFLSDRIEIKPISLDDFSHLRYLNERSLRAHTVDVLSEDEVVAFRNFVYSAAYSDQLMQEEVYGAWLNQALVGSISWHPVGDDGATARIGPVFVDYQRLGIGRRLMAEAEGRAHHCGFAQFTAWATANAVPFFERLGYQVVSRGVKTLSPECALPVTFLRKVLPRPSGYLS
jgi:GNAT superfamily N-acetyltransferase